MKSQLELISNKRDFHSAGRAGQVRNQKDDLLSSNKKDDHIKNLLNGKER